ncbi:MAG TPA: hypothetical protein VMH23_11000 [Bacteroidota bacterium]|nr:hypothetical protein [Bacteroidota bacterium]
MEANGYSGDKILGKNAIGSAIIDNLFGGETAAEECGPITESEFRMLMTIVALAALAFGCIVHGWWI